MKPFSDMEKKNRLSRLYWDVSIDPEQLYGLLKGEIERIGHVDILNFFSELRFLKNNYP